MSAVYRFCPQCGSELAQRRIEDVPRLACPSDECGFVHYDNPTPVVTVLPQLGDRVVLARHRGWPEKMFSLITGFVESREDPADAARRELAEELGLRAEATTLIGVYTFVPFNQLLVAYHVVATGEIRVGDELAAIKEVPVERLKAWPIGPGLAVRDWLAARGRG